MGKLCYVMSGLRMMGIERNMVKFCTITSLMKWKEAGSSKHGVGIGV